MVYTKSTIDRKVSWLVHKIHIRRWNRKLGQGSISFDHLVYEFSEFCRKSLVDEQLGISCFLEWLMSSQDEVG